MPWIDIVSRWTHIGTAIVLVGGLCFMRFVLAPAAAQLSEGEHAKLKELVMARWKKFIHIGIVLFLVSGFYNYYAVFAQHQKVEKPYHMLLGIKMILALVIFFLSSALVGRSKAFAGMRANPKLWQTVILVIAAVIVGISGFAKVALKPTAAKQSGTVPTTQSAPASVSNPVEV